MKLMNKIKLGLCLGLGINSPCHDKEPHECTHGYFNIPETKTWLTEQSESHYENIQYLAQKLEETNKPEEREIIELNIELYRQAKTLIDLLHQYVLYLENHHKDVKRLFHCLHFMEFLLELHRSLGRPASFREIQINLANPKLEPKDSEIPKGEGDFKGKISENLKREDFFNYITRMNVPLATVIKGAQAAHHFMTELEKHPEIVTKKENHPDNGGVARATSLPNKARVFFIFFIPAIVFIFLFLPFNAL